MKVVAVLLALVSVCRASGIGLSAVQVDAPLALSAGGILGAPGIINANGLGLGGLGLGLSAVQVNSGLTRLASPIGIAAAPVGLSTVQLNSAPIGLAAPGIITTNGLGLGLGAPGVITTNGLGLGLGAPGVITTNGLGLSTVQVNSGLTRAAIAAPIGVSGLSTVQVNSAPVALAAAHAGAVSVNANRGSVHVAPLPGHIVGSKQLNLSPAPGTW